MDSGETYAPVLGPANFLIDCSLLLTSRSSCMRMQQQQQHAFRQSSPKLPLRLYILRIRACWIRVMRPGKGLARRGHFLGALTHIESHRQSPSIHRPR
jgi:hypothetical protein